MIKNDILPFNWILTNIETICFTTSGGTPARKNPSYYDGKIPWLKSGELKYNIIFSCEETISESGLANSSTKIILKGTILIALYGATVGKLAVLGIDAAINQAICAIIPPIDISNKFLYWYLFDQRSQLLNLRKGGAQPNISQKIINEIVIPLPPLPEQHRIVEKIEEEFTRLDAGVSALKKAKALIPKYRQSVLKAAMCGDLTEERWQRKECGNCENEWKWQLIKDIAVVSGGLTKNPKRLQYSLKYPYLRVANVYSNRLELDEVLEIGINEAEIDRCSLQKGDLLVVEGNGSIDQIGRVALWDGSIDPCLHQNHLIKVRFNKNCNNKFALYWMMSPVGRDKIISASSSTSGLNTLSIRKINNLPIPIPPLEEQHEIICEIERRFSVIDEMEKVVNDSLAKAERLRQSVLKKAFEGRLVPQNPNDEPASVLLERIQAEKEQRAAEEKAGKKKLKTVKKNKV